MCNDKKIAFIICSNNELYYEECLWYINNLRIPEGYETDIISITEAGSIMVAYNAAMKSTDAKYKVYLHHDVFIYNKNFIQEVVDIFKSECQLGMLGVVGGIYLPKNAVIWNAWNKGTTYACNNEYACKVVGKQNPEIKWEEVEAIDGMIMITQYDIDWREDLNLGWDFYDVSQSLEFRRKGYKVGVPYQETPWCMHDCGYSKLMNYDRDREKILKEYRDYFAGEFLSVSNGEMLLLQEQIFGQIKAALEQKNFMQAIQMKAMIGERKIESNNLQYALNLIEIYEKESAENKQNAGFFTNVSSWEEMKEKYDIIKFLLRRWEIKKNSEAFEFLLEMIKKGVLSENALQSIEYHCVIL